MKVSVETEPGAVGAGSSQELLVRALGAGQAQGQVSRLLTELPRGRHRLSPEFVFAHQRERLMQAVSELCASQGYAATTIAHIVRAAGVSQRTFGKHFASKQACFLAAYESHLTGLEGRLREITVGVSPWPERLAVGLKALLEELACRPALAHTLFVDALFAGDEAKHLRQRILRRYQKVLPIPDGAPPGVAETVVGGIVEMIYHTIREDQTQALPGMYPEMLYCLLLPLRGHEEAASICSRFAEGSSA